MRLGAELQHGSASPSKAMESPHPECFGIRWGLPEQGSLNSKQWDIQEIIIALVT